MCRGRNDDRKSSGFPTLDQLLLDGFNQLNAPYDAKVIGDYVGLTPPFGFDY